MSLLNLFFENKEKLSEKELIKSRAPVSGLTDSDNFGFEMKVKQGHVYLETGTGTPLIFCHGIFGSFRNIAQIGQQLADRYRIIVPCMPMYDAPLNKCTVEDLSLYLEKFIEDLNLQNVVLVGNSMGGGTVLLYTIRHPERVQKLILFASSGLSFIPMRGGAMKLKDRNYVHEMMDDIFYGPSPFSPEEFEQVFQILQNKSTLLRVLGFTRSTKRNFLHNELKKISHPTLVIWGQEDKVTPPFIAEEFRTHLVNSEIHYLKECGHVPPYEKPEECLDLMENFLSILGK